jgi:hypothetical protein
VPSGLSLTGVRLVILTTARGFPCCVRFPYGHAAATTPVQQAGVSTSFSSFDAHLAHNLRQIAGNAVAQGLSRSAALSAISREPARAFGLSDGYGELAPGKVANFCVWNADPFELSSWATSVVVRGEPTRLRSRQDELFERYRDLESVPQGRRGSPRRP